MKKISKRQYYIHLIFEALAVFLVTPWMIYLGFYVLDFPHNLFAFLVVVGTLAVDGGLLIVWFKKRGEIFK